MIYYLSMSVLAFAIHSGMSATTKVTFNQGFDTLVVVPDEVRLNPIGTFNYLQYTNVDAAQPGALNESLSGVISHSKLNYAILAQSPGTLSVAYAGSPVKALTLNSFYYACAINLPEGAIGAAAEYTVTVAGYKAGSSTPAATQSFTFTPAEPVDVMNPTSLANLSSGFQKLQMVMVAIDNATTAKLVVDNVTGSTQS